jgi:alpha-galactosidase/6-phospho-beta-glucosidase family protein
MIWQIKRKVEQKVKERRRKWKRERMKRKRKRKKKKSGAEAHGLEKLQVLRGLIAGEDGSVAVDLPNLGAQHVFILTVLCFHCRGIIRVERFTATKWRPTY